jgi:hypothetical protein
MARPRSHEPVNAARDTDRSASSAADMWRGGEMRQKRRSKGLQYANGAGLVDTADALLDRLSVCPDG